MPRRVGGSEKRQRQIWLIRQILRRTLPRSANLCHCTSLNPKDTKAAGMVADLLTGQTWCPPAASEIRYRQDTLLAATFAPRTNNEIFAAAGDGQLLLWKGDELSLVQSWSLFEKPKPTDQQVVQPGFASFSPDGQWLVHYSSDARFGCKARKLAVQGTSAQGAPPARPGGRHDTGKCRSGDGRRKIKHTSLRAGIWRFQRLPGSRINFAWSNESDRLVLINARG